MGKIIDETGKQYGYWTVIKRLPRDTTKGGSAGYVNVNAELRKVFAELN